jgi:hypothetical protein
MRIVSFAIISMVVAAPAYAQPYDQHRGFEGPQRDRAAQVDDHQARHLARDADQDQHHANRDAAVGDYHGAEHAEQRARAEAQGARGYAHDAQHERGERYGNGHSDSH